MSWSHHYSVVPMYYSPVVPGIFVSNTDVQHGGVCWIVTCSLGGVCFRRVSHAALMPSDVHIANGT